MFMKKALAVLGLTGMLALPLAAQAQSAADGSQDEVIHGTIASLEGQYTIYVHDQRGFVDTVRLHDGTIINPTGLTLEPGQSVEIHGRTDGHVFDANEIDTPYTDQAGTDDSAGYSTDDAPPPAPVYVAPYPYYSYYPAYAIAYPAFVSLGFGFGWGCCYGGFYGGGFFGHGYYGPGYYGHGYYGHGYYGRFYSHEHPLAGYRAFTGTSRSSGSYSGRSTYYGGGYSRNSGVSGGYRAPTSGYRSSAVSGYRSSGGGYRGGGSTGGYHGGSSGGSARSGGGGAHR
jgi:hypothetical protein